MALIDKLKELWPVSVLLVCVAVAVATWKVSVEVLVEPRDFEIETLRNANDEAEKKLAKLRSEIAQFEKQLVDSTREIKGIGSNEIDLPQKSCPDKVVVSKESASQQKSVAQQFSTICEFTSGPRAGTRVDYAPRQAVPVGSTCLDAAGSTGTVVSKESASQQKPVAQQFSTICEFTSGPRAGTRVDYAPRQAIPVGSTCLDAAGSTGTVVPKN